MRIRSLDSYMQRSQLAHAALSRLSPHFASASTDLHSPSCSYRSEMLFGISQATVKRNILPGYALHSNQTFQHVNAHLAPLVKAACCQHAHAIASSLKL